MFDRICVILIIVAALMLYTHIMYAFAEHSVIKNLRLLNETQIEYKGIKYEK